MKNRIVDEYFDYICNLICDSKFKRNKKAYSKLLYFLFDTPFRYSMEMDENRYQDGLNLRYRFAVEYRYSEHYIFDMLSDRDCSVLEMMVSVANRCEESCIDDPELGSQTGFIFWKMVESLGLIYSENRYFDLEFVDYTIQRFLNREYFENGEGGLFTLRFPRRDMTTVEIWMQACWWLNESFERGTFND